MSLADWFRRAFLDVEHAAETLIHQAEKEIIMSIPQTFTDALAKITGRRTSDAQTIANLQAQVTAKDSQISGLTSELADATGQIRDMEAAALAEANAADGAVV